MREEVTGIGALIVGSAMYAAIFAVCIYGGQRHDRTHNIARYEVQAIGPKKEVECARTQPLYEQSLQRFATINSKGDTIATRVEEGSESAPLRLQRLGCEPRRYGVRQSPETTWVYQEITPPTQTWFTGVGKNLLKGEMDIIRMRPPAWARVQLTITPELQDEYLGVINAVEKKKAETAQHK